MTIKVVYNAGFGGFSISRACVERMAELGNQEAKEMLADPETYPMFCGYDFCGYLHNTPRHDPVLVQAVEGLGENASGGSASLCVRELSGNRYIINEYDGKESVVEPDDIKWTIVNKKNVNKTDDRTSLMELKV